MRLPLRHLVLAAWLVLALAASAEDAPQVAVQLEIRDALTGTDLDVSIRRKVVVGTDAVSFIDDVVDMEYRRYPGVGIFVTSLCGVAAPKSAFWALSINGERATKGISELTIKEPVRIRWDLVELGGNEP